MSSGWESAEHRRAERQRAAFFEVSRRLSAARTPEEAARIIVGVAQELIGWDACSLDLYDPETNLVQDVLTMDSLDDGSPVDVPPAYTQITPGPMFARVLREGATLILRSSAEPTHGLVTFGDTERRSRSLMFVPIRYGERPTGIVSIQSYTTDAYDDDSLATLQELADHCGGAIERLRIEHELMESQEQLARTEAFALVMTARLSLDGRWLKVPPTLCRLLGVDDTRLLGTPMGALLHPDDVAAERAGRDRLVAGETRSVDLETRWPRADGRVLWMYLNLSVVPDAHGRPVSLLAYLRDFTDRKNLEDQLRQAQKMEAVGQLAGGIAHDFNNLLTAIMGYSELLLDQVSDQPDVAADLREIRKAGERARGLTSQLLAFSRTQVLQPRILDLNAVVSEVEGMLRRVISEDIRFEITVDPSLSRVKADPGQIHQVLMNLAINARDAMPRGGTLRITTANPIASVGEPRPGVPPSPQRCVALTVSDTGCGMAPDVTARIFEPFFTTKAPGKGTGLGLSMVYGVVAESGGRISVESERDRGTTFTIHLPVAEGATISTTSSVAER